MSDIAEKLVTPKTIAGFFLTIMWLAGMVLAKGFWSMFFAIFTPYGMYLVVELLMKRGGIV